MFYNYECIAPQLFKNSLQLRRVSKVLYIAFMQSNVKFLWSSSQHLPRLLRQP